MKRGQPTPVGANGPRTWLHNACAKLHRMDTWDDLRVLLEVSRDHSLSATAARLKTSHTTLSRRLAALEQSLSARLVERTGAGVTMTRLGKELVARAQQMETAALDAERWVSGDDQRLEGRVRLSTTEAFAQHLLFPSLRVFQDAYPAIELEVLVGNTQVDLSKGEADVAIRAAPTKTPSLVAKRVATLAVGLYASIDYGRRYLSTRTARATATTIKPRPINRYGSTRCPAGATSRASSGTRLLPVTVPRSCSGASPCWVVVTRSFRCSMMRSRPL